MHSALSSFRFEADGADLVALRERVREARWPAQIAHVGWDRGVPIDYLQELARRWAHSFSWRAVEERINALEQVTTSIDGANIHAIHIRSSRPNAIPLVMTHGWPGSVLEFLDIAVLLTEPCDGEVAFHLVLPSLPGFGFSGPVQEPGWEHYRTAQAWAILMTRLGYERFGAQGGDWGATVSRELGRMFPDRVIGVHLNLIPGAQARCAPTETDLKGLDAEDRDRWWRSWEKTQRWQAEQEGYAIQQATRPQTLAYALTDSPIGQLAWIAEKLHAWSDPTSSIDADWLLANATLYWLTRTAGSSAAIYYERAHTSYPTPAPSPTPTALADFPYENFIPIRQIAERSNNIVRWTTMNRGGHFAALETPDLLADDIRAFFATLDQTATS